MSTLVPLLLYTFTVQFLGSHIKASDFVPRDLDGVSLLEEPQVSFDLKPEKKIRVPRGRSVNLTCAVTAIPPASIRWFRNSKELGGHGADLKDRNEVEKMSNFGRKTLQMASTQSHLVIDCMNEARTGVYACVADNGYSQIFASSYVAVDGSVASEAVTCAGEERKRSGKIFRRRQPSPARISMVTDARMELAGASVQLFCRASGWPAPQISWYTYDNVEDENHLGLPRKIDRDASHLILSNGDLLISSEGLIKGSAGAGYYMCVAKNPLAEDHSPLIMVSILEE